MPETAQRGSNSLNAMAKICYNGYVTIDTKNFIRYRSATSKKCHHRARWIKYSIAENDAFRYGTAVHHD